MSGKMVLTTFLLFLIYSLTSHGGVDGYELENYLTAENLFLRQKISLASGYFNLPGIANTNDQEKHFVRQGLLQPVLEVPLYALGYLNDQVFQRRPQFIQNLGLNSSPLSLNRLLAVSLFNPLMTALTAFLVGVIVKELGRTTEKIGLAAMLTYGLSTMAWPYAAIGLEPLMVFTLVLSFYVWLKWKNEANDNYLILLGLALLMLINTKSYAWVLVFPFILFVLVRLLSFGLKRKEEFPLENSRRSSRMSIVLFWSLVFLGFFIFFGFNLYKSGHPFGGAQGVFLEGLSWEIIPLNFLAVSISFGKSLFVYSPFLILSLWNFRKFIRAFPQESLLIIACMVLLLGFFLPLFWLSADETWGPRYLLPLVPFLVIVSFFFLGQQREPSSEILKYQGINLKSALVGILFVLGVWVQILGVLYGSTTPLMVAFAAGARSVEEINFNPIFSPVNIGSRLLVSTINRLSNGRSLTFQVSKTTNWAGAGGRSQKGPRVNMSQYDGNLVIWPVRFF